MTAAAGCYCEQPIVLDPFTFLIALLCLDNPDQSGGEHATDRGRGVQQHEHVQRIPIVAEGGRHKAEIERQRHSLRQDGDEAKGAAVAVVIVFVGTSFRGFDPEVEMEILSSDESVNLTNHEADVAIRVVYEQT